MNRQQQNHQPQTRMLPARAVAERYGVSLKTVDRWLETKLLPEPMRVNGYRYWRDDALDDFDARMSTGGDKPQTASAA